MSARRERWSVAGAILLAIEAEARHGAEPRLSAIASAANVPHDRLVPYLDALVAQGLVTEGPRLTPRGRAFLREYREWLAYLDRFGFSAPPRAAWTAGESARQGSGTRPNQA